MVVARLVGLVGGSATFAQVLLSLPMTLDLLGTQMIARPSSREIADRLRRTFIPVTVPLVHTASLSVFDHPTFPEKHPIGTPGRLSLHTLALHLDNMHIHNSVLLPPSSCSFRLDEYTPLGESCIGQCPPIHLRQRAALG